MPARDNSDCGVGRVAAHGWQKHIHRAAPIVPKPEVQHYEVEAATKEEVAGRGGGVTAG
jgi:hypothetical protein